MFSVTVARVERWIEPTTRTMTPAELQAYVSEVDWSKIREFKAEQIKATWTPEEILRNEG